MENMVLLLRVSRLSDPDDLKGVPAVAFSFVSGASEEEFSNSFCSSAYECQNWLTSSPFVYTTQRKKKKRKKEQGMPTSYNTYCGSFLILPASLFPLQRPAFFSPLKRGQTTDCSSSFLSGDFEPLDRSGCVLWHFHFNVRKG